MGDGDIEFEFFKVTVVAFSRGVFCSAELTVHARMQPETRRR
jgi:hypothetical protein